ncbi:MAG: hypothetical protein GY903_32865 [Fuerstiella sp.]|nr:hypothetical protein [Fuerstiella sp.]MCP4859284.1 hypothetical protein [Fuerstiella sp.]
MSNSLKNNLFPVLSVMTGVAVTVLCVGWMESLEKPDAEEQAAIDEFGQLEPGQQVRLRNQAAGFEAQDAEYKKRIISIHEAVTDDPSLESKLRTLHDWRRQLDATQEAEIRSLDSKSAEWVSKVQRAYLESHAADNMVTVWLPGPPPPTGERRSVDLTETQFEKFLELFIPEDTPSELASQLSGFKPDESCEITLTKIIWIIFQMRPSPGPWGRPPQQGPPSQPEGSPNAIYDSFRISNARQLFDPDEWELLQATFKSQYDDTPNVSENARRFQEAMLFITCIRGGLEHYRRVFKEKHLGDRNGSLSTLVQNDNELVDVFENHIDRNAQLDLMTADPGHAAEVLEMLRKKLDTEDSAVAGLFSDLARLPPQWTGRGRGGMGRGSSFGGRGGYGRSDRDDNRGGGRDRNEGRGKSRPGGGGPPRDGRSQFR